MKFIPILFSTEMVQAILAGRKTQTRRVLKLSNYHPSRTEKQPEVMTVKDLKLYDGNGELIGDLIMKYGNPGDVLWVRESFLRNPIGQSPFLYKASALVPRFLRWKPSIHMPKDACRIFLKIKDVRVERLQHIDKLSAINEGVEIIFDAETHVPVYRKYNLKEKLGTIHPILSFYSLWEKINGKGSVELNPFVWVIEFENIEKPKNFLS